MVERKEYLDQLWAWKDERQIKVVTGIRRCGKSVLLEQYQQRLLANGVAPEQIISINFENLDVGKKFLPVTAAASSNANTNVSMMGETFKYCAPIAGALGFSAEDP